MMVSCAKLLRQKALFRLRGNCLIGLLLSLYLLAFSSVAVNSELIVGAEQPSLYLPLLENKRVGVVVNQSSTAFNQHLVDYLRGQSINVTAIYSPEHGFRGDKGAGEKIASETDATTGLPVHSLYGKTRKPNAKMLADVDVLVFDIQDVGVRFYTYISTLHYVMEAAADFGKSVVVLDRPNPNIMHVDGPILELEYQSFVGMHPIPILHGMTVAELAQMIKGEAWIEKGEELALTVIPVANYDRNTFYSLPIKPSPNLPNDIAIQLYPSLCLFEPTQVSIGRGTDFPFQVIGHDIVDLGSFTFTPRSMPNSAPSPKLQDRAAQGIDLRNSEIKGVDLSFLFKVHQQFKLAGKTLITSTSFFDKLAGTDAVRLALESGENFHQVKAQWEEPLKHFKVQRKPYLLYAN